jgi:invasion protein IalB
MARSELPFPPLAMLGGAIFLLGAIALVYFFTRAENMSAADLPEPGFVGTANYGDWELICAQRAEMAPPLVAFDQPDSETAGAVETESACRLRHEVLSQAAADGAPSQVILAAHLSLVGPAERPALMLRLPATLTEGDSVILRTRDDVVVETVARDCSTEECIAASTLTDQEWDRIIEADALQAVFRVDGSQLISVDISTDGLPEALAALHSAQSARPSKTEPAIGE